MRAKILIVGPAWVGDMMMAQSLFKLLKEQVADCQIDVLAPAWSLDLLACMPEVRSGIAMPLTHGQLGLGARFALGRRLRAESYTQAIVLPNSWKSALVPYFANIPTRTGYLGEARWGLLNDARKLDKTTLPMTVQRFVALGLPAHSALPPDCPTPALSVTPLQQQAVQEKFAVDGNNPKILALCPGAEYGPAKRWPASHFAEVARHKLSQGWQVWLFGSAKDQPIAEQINRENAGFCRDFTGQTTLGEAVSLLSLVHTVVSNDSGLMHVAAALNKKLLALYGSSDPGFTPPLSENSQILSLHLDCSPCFKRTCPLEHTRCLTGLLPEQVLERISIRSPKP